MPQLRLQKPVLFALSIGSWPFYKNNLLGFLFSDCTWKGFFLSTLRSCSCFCITRLCFSYFIFCKRFYCLPKGRVFISPCWAGEGGKAPSFSDFIGPVRAGEGCGRYISPRTEHLELTIGCRRVLCFLVLWAAYVSLERFHLNPLKRTSDLLLRKCSII